MVTRGMDHVLEPVSNIICTGPPSRQTNGFLNSYEGSWVGGGGASAWNSKAYIYILLCSASVHNIQGETHTHTHTLEHSTLYNIQNNTLLLP